MTNYIITTSFVASAGNGLDLPGDFDFAFVAPGVTLGSSSLSGRGIRVTGTSVTVTVAGTVVGGTGIELLGIGATLKVLEGGMVAAAGTAFDLAVAGAASNAGTITGSRGFYCESELYLNNTGSIRGETDAVFVLGGGALTNTGTIEGFGTAVFFDGTAEIFNFGQILGGVILNGLGSSLLNRGLITGGVQTGDGSNLVDNDGGRIAGAVFLGGGNDQFVGGAFAETVRGWAGDDAMAGGAGDDVFVADDADGLDEIDGGTGIDTYDARNLTLATVVNLTTGLARSGGMTDDLTSIERVIGGLGKDRLTGDGGANTLLGSDGADTLSGLAGADRLNGGAGNDSLLGGDGNDRLIGGDGRDLLNGEAGDDVLIGGNDVDTMTGGAGADRFVWTDFEEFIAVVSGLDRITDFAQGQDQIDISAIDARFADAGDQAFSFIGTGVITDFGQISYRTTASATFVSISVFSASPLEVLRLDGILALTAADFVL